MNVTATVKICNGCVPAVDNDQKYGTMVIFHKTKTRKPLSYYHHCGCLEEMCADCDCLCLCVCLRDSHVF